MMCCKILLLPVCLFLSCLEAQVTQPPRAARSVHLRYPAENVLAFYNEIRVTESVPGSYFMACGFTGGYFGVQQLMEDGPGMVLFSVWDPHPGDNPDVVPGEKRVQVRYQGPGVSVDRFGGEGTGAKTFFPYEWAPGDVHRFLVTVRRIGDRTAYSGFYFRNDQQQWVQLATLEAPGGNDHLDGLYSFVEDFRRDGLSVQQTRRATFGNGWVFKESGGWTPITEAVFSADGTPLNNVNASVVNGRFELATGGDVQQDLKFWESLTLDKAEGIHPDLPVLRGEPLLIPQPVRLQTAEGAFVLPQDLTIRAAQGLEAPAAYLADLLTPVLGLTPAVAQGGAAPGGISLLLDPSLPPEGYRLRVLPAGVAVVGSESRGILHGIHTLLQLMPPQMLGPAAPRLVQVELPLVDIADQPRFSWRGLMLDPCRHFLPLDRVKKMVDVMALQKMSVLHLHLTEDQGWRIEIKKYPRLTEVGSIRKETPMRGNRNQGDGTPYGPYFYSQDELRDLVAYAAERGITVVPEIEMPGHSMAALTAYPQLGCTGGPYEVRTRWGVEPHIYCAGKESTFEFLEDVLDEVLDIFPSRVIHVGGDEAPKDQWKQCAACQKRIQEEGLKNEHELQSYFITRMEKYLNDRGRILIGWDEILEGGLAPNAKVMSWRGEQGGIVAAQSGHDVVMSPTSHCYFDYAQAQGPGEPEAIGGFVPLKTVYSYNPVPSALTPEQAKHVTGTQGNLWSEYFFTPDKMEYFAFPRASALAEVAWTPLDRKDYPDFRKRLTHHLQRLNAYGINYREPDDEVGTPIGGWASGETDTVFRERSWPVEASALRAGENRFLFQYTGGEHRLDIDGVVLTADGVQLAEDSHTGITGGFHQDNLYRLTLAEVLPGAAYRLTARIRSDGGNDSNGEILLLPEASPR